jgi:hypothetical protein
VPKLPPNFVERSESAKAELLRESDQTTMMKIPEMETDAINMANRVLEVDIFRQLLNSDVQKRILLVKAPESYGKSHLIDCFRQICWQHSRVKIVTLDLLNSTSGIAYFISRMQRKLSDERFPRYEKELNRLSTMQKNVEMLNIDIVGNENTLKILLDTDEILKQQRLRQLEMAFFEDLEQIKSILVILIDSFEKAPDDLKKWIRGTLLPEAAESLRCLRVVIAGREIPEVSSEWRSYHHCCELTLIRDVDAWYKYAQNQGWQVTEQMVCGLVLGVKGHPGIIAEGLPCVDQGVNS